MKGLIFIIIVTIVVLASFARPEKEIGSNSSSRNTELSAKNQSVVVRDSSIVHKQGI